MEFYLDKVFVSLSADDVKIGSKGYCADSLVNLKTRVENEDKLAYGGQYMKQAIKAMMSADYIFMMKGYKESKGARLELLIAKVLKFNIIYEQ